MGPKKRTWKRHDGASDDEKEEGRDAGDDDEQDDFREAVKNSFFLGIFPQYLNFI